VLLNTLTQLDIYATHNIVINKRYMCLWQPFFVVLTLAIDSFMATGSFVENMYIQQKVHTSLFVICTTQCLWMCCTERYGLYMYIHYISI